MPRPMIRRTGLCHLGHQGGAVVSGHHRAVDPVRACACAVAGKLRHGRDGARAGVQDGVADPASAQPKLAGGGGVGRVSRATGWRRRDGRLVDTGRAELTFRRTPYDVAGAARKVRAAGLPEELAVRLLVGTVGCRYDPIPGFRSTALHSGREAAHRRVRHDLGGDASGP
jgi:hypothetical protein